MTAFVSPTSCLITSLSSTTTTIKSSSSVCGVSSKRTHSNTIHRRTSFLPALSNENNNISNKPMQNIKNKRETIKNVLTEERLANKAYQLEEDEDEASSTTAVYFHKDGTLTLGRTDGPEPDRVKATWKYNDADGELFIDIERYFKGERDIEFMVKRVLRGHLDETRLNLFDLPIFEGAMYPYPSDYDKHTEIGFFALILAVDDLPSEDYDVSQDN